MSFNPSLAEDHGRRLRPRFVTQVFWFFAALAVLGVCLSLAGKWAGRTIALAGHTDDRTLHEVVVGNDVIAVPANMIRFENARRSGVASRLDLYARWGDFSGYSTETRDDFNHIGDSRNILFLSFQERAMTRDMSGRFQPIYRSLIDPNGEAGPAGLSIHRFRVSSGFLDEVLVVGDVDRERPFVARCLAPEQAAGSLAPCERDIHVGEQLSLSYRFPERLLGEWRDLDRAVLTFAYRLLQTDR